MSIRVDLVEGRGERYWPRPGRLFAASMRHSYEQFATAIELAFARWDRSHLYEFEFGDGTRIGVPDPDSIDEDVLDGARETLVGLRNAQQFTYVFDFGDDWTHLCTVTEVDIEPRQVLGLVPNIPTPYFGWGNMPDQYGRAWPDEDSESSAPPDPELTDLPALRPDWGPHT